MWGKIYTRILYVVLVLSMATSVCAGETLEEAFKEGTPYVDVRYRYEYVNQEGGTITKNAHASTVRTQFGYKSGEYEGFSALLEFENVTEVGSDNYNNTINGRSDRPVVADVESTEFNQGYLKYTGLDDFTIQAGRQVITLDNHRFIGHVGWRQNNQTFDAATIENTSIEDTTIKYGYIYNVNRIFSDESSVGDFKSDSHYLNIKNTALPLLNVTGYAYLLDFQSDSPALSNQTYGIRLTGKKKCEKTEAIFAYTAEYAYQSDYGDNTTNYDTFYYTIEPSISYGGFTATVGYEVLGSDGGVIGFATPLATLHKFNGWADVFLGTPIGGLEDLYVDLTYKFSDMEGALKCLNGLLAKVQYHDFQAEDGGMDYGTEFGAYLKKPINKHMYAELKYADYEADMYASDRQKITFGFGIKY